jgi:hypothetical protein
LIICSAPPANSLQSSAWITSILKGGRS